MSRREEGPAVTLPVLAFVVAMTVLMGLLSHGTSFFVTAIHDEISYVFQARTFLLGRVTNPVHPERAFFDAYHIINEGVYASKYFPGFAVTLMPFVHFNAPFLNPILFYGLEILLIFVIARELFGTRVAWIAMMLSSVSPQVALPSFVVLSHATCAVFLLLFFLGFIKTERNGLGVWTLVSAVSLAAAMLTRPATALGVAFPVAVLVARRLWLERTAYRVKAVLLWGLPLILGLSVFACYNKAVTGSYLETPFEHYASMHAPYHRYGFHTREQFEEESRSPRVQKEFNEESADFTPVDGLFNVCSRFDYWTWWIIGDRGLAVAGILLAIGYGAVKRDRWLLLMVGMWVSLQAVHWPHFFVGVAPIGSNFLYETSGLAILCGVKAAHDTLVSLVPPRRQKIVAATAVILCAFSCVSFLDSNREMISLTRSLKRRLDLAVGHIQKGVVFVRYGPKHRIPWDVIDNVPTLDSDVIIARDRGPANARLVPHFPGYRFYLFDEQSSQLLELTVRTSE